MTTSPILAWRDPEPPRRGRVAMITAPMIHALTDASGRWGVLISEPLADGDAGRVQYAKLYAARKTAMRRYPDCEFVVRIERTGPTPHVVLFGRHRPA